MVLECGLKDGFAAILMFNIEVMHPKHQSAHAVMEGLSSQEKEEGKNKKGRAQWGAEVVTILCKVTKTPLGN